MSKELVTHEPLVDKLDSLPLYSDFEIEIENRLSPKDQEIFGQNAQEVIATGLASLGAFAPEPATFDSGAFHAICAPDMTDQQQNRLTEISIETGLVSQDPETRRYRLSAQAHPRLQEYMDEEETSTI